MGVLLRRAVWRLKENFAPREFLRREPGAVKPILSTNRLFDRISRLKTQTTELSMPRITELHVNGSKHPINADSERTLLSVLRDDLGLTGAKYGCGEGEC